MAFSLNITDWNALGEVWSPGASANPVLRLKSSQSASPLWLKAATGGKRIAFAGNVMMRVGFGTAGTRVVDDPERAFAFRRMHAVVDAMGTAPEVATLNEIIQAMEARILVGQDLILMDDVQGQEFMKTVEQGTKGEYAKTLMPIYLQATIQEDIARLIAADLFLGNFDRMAINTGDSIRTGSWVKTKYNARNWIYDNHHFLPIDNDTFAPSLQHLGKTGGGYDPVLKKNRPRVDPTPEDVYRIVIEGGVLAATQEMENLFAVSTQGSVDAVLGPEGKKNILAILTGDFTPQELTQHAADLDTLGTAIFKRVKEVMAELIQECKNPKGMQEGLNKLLKAHSNVEGMNYSAFKVRSRFAEMMLDTSQPDRSVDDAKSEALAYGKYRDWKEIFLSMLEHNPLAAYQDLVPTKEFGKLSTPGKFWRGLKNSSPVASSSMRMLLTEAEQSKIHVRSGLPMDKEQLIQELRNRKPELVLESRFVKVQTLQLSQLLQLEMDQYTAFLNTVVQGTFNDVIGKYYKKALLKRRTDLHALADNYYAMISLMENHLAALGTKDTALFGQAALNGKLALLRTSITAAAG